MTADKTPTGLPADIRLDGLGLVLREGTAADLPVMAELFEGRRLQLAITGQNFGRSKKFRDVQATGRAALVIDGVLPLWRPRDPRPRRDGACAASFRRVRRDGHVRSRPHRPVPSLPLMSCVNGLGVRFRSATLRPPCLNR